MIIVYFDFTYTVLRRCIVFYYHLYFLIAVFSYSAFEAASVF